jgi:sporulation protein YlmC with PRC-barrel domain
MKRKKFSALTAITVVLFIVSFTGIRYAAAQEPGELAGDERLIPASEVVPASQVLEYGIYNEEGVQFGNVEELFVDMAAGYVIYLGFQPEEAAGEDIVLFPVDLLRVDTENKRLVANIDQEDLLGYAPMMGARECEGLDRGTPYFRKITTYWQNAGVYVPPEAVDLPIGAYEPFTRTIGARMVPGTIVPYSVIRDNPIQDAEGGEIGRFEDLLFNIRTGRAHLLAASVQGSIYPLPLGAFTYKATMCTLMLDPEQTLLEEAPTIGTQSFGQEYGEQEIRNVYSYWNEASPRVLLRQAARVVPVELQRVSTIQQYSIVDTDLYELGDIADLVVSADGMVPYVVVDGEGIDPQAGWYYLPLAALTLDPFHNYAIVDLDRGKFLELASYEEEELPDPAAPDWDSEIRVSWRNWLSPEFEQTGAQADQLGMAGTEAFYTSDLQEYQVVGTGGEEVAEVEEIIVNLTDSTFGFLVVSPPGLNLDEEWIPVPPSAFTISGDEQLISLKVAGSALEEAPGFEEDEWPNLRDPEWTNQVEQYWQGKE